MFIRRFNRMNTHVMNSGTKHSLYKLIPYRKTFAQALTEAERKVMQENTI